MDRVVQTFQFLRTAFIAALFLCASVIANANIAGQVIMVKGTATAISADGKERTLQRRSEIHASDTIVTGTDSRVQIRFIDNALLALQEKSRLNIREYNFAKESGESEKVLMELVEGGFRTLTGTIGKGNREAYAVNTPVASIGVRGTLYSVHLSGPQLSAGVWQGGIVITTPNGREFNLGRDSSFSFGVFNNNNFRGLRTPPADLDAGDNNDTDAPNGDDSNPNNTSGGDDNNGPGESSDDHFADTDLNTPSSNEALNSFEQMNNANKDAYIEKAGSEAGIVRNPAPELLSDEEFRAYTASNRHGVMMVNGEAVYGKYVEISGRQPLFVVNNNSQYSVYSSTGTVDYDDLSTTNFTDTSLTQGIWSGTNLNSSSTIQEPVNFITADLFKTADPSFSVYRFESTYAGPGKDSLDGNLENQDMSFYLNLGSGAISDGSFLAQYFNEDTQSSSNWNFGFNGQLNFQTGLANFEIIEDPNGIIISSDYDGDQHYFFLNTDDSNISGFVFRENEATNFLTWHNLIAENNGEFLTAYGSYAWQGQKEASTPSEADIRPSHAAFAYIDGEIHFGHFLESNGYRVFLGSMDMKSDYTGVAFRANDTSTHTPQAGVSWGVWNNAPIFKHTIDYRNDANVNEISELRYVEAQIFNEQGALQADYSFSVASNAQFVGVDNFGNSLQTPTGSFSISNSSISSGNLTLTYGDDNAANQTIWNFDFSVDWSGDSGLLTFYLGSTANVTHNSQSDLISELNMTGVLLVNPAIPDQVNGALTGLHVTGEVQGQELWANGILQWNSYQNSVTPGGP